MEGAKGITDKHFAFSLTKGLQLPACTLMYKLDSHSLFDKDSGGKECNRKTHGNCGA
jgi:hypothetical protein